MIIYILDIETTGLRGYPADDIVEIGITSVNVTTHTIKRELQEVVHYDIKEWAPRHEHSWIFTHSSLNLDDIQNAKYNVVEIAERVQKLLKNQKVAAYNVNFDFGRFLNFEPWDLRNIVEVLPCIMETSTAVCKLPSTSRYHKGYKWPKLPEAYEIICRKEMIESDKHRAIDDAYYASEIFLQLVDHDQYNGWT